MSAEFTVVEKNAVMLREGFRCSMECGRVATTANHRLNRKMGGRGKASPVGSLANACAICDVCNDGIESDATLREEALRRGVKLEEHQDPEETLMWHPLYRSWVRLGVNLTFAGVFDPRLDARTISDGEAI